MAQQTMRGMRLGAQSLENERGVVLEGRSAHSYQCADGHVSELIFAADADVPALWECKTCSKDAVLVEEGKSVDLGLLTEKTPRSHWEMLLERRSLDELEEILQERLEVLHAKRAAGAASSEER
jgi:hypothetical protein